MHWKIKQQGFQIFRWFLNGQTAFSFMLPDIHFLEKKQHTDLQDNLSTWCLNNKWENNYLSKNYAIEREFGKQMYKNVEILYSLLKLS